MNKDLDRRVRRVLDHRNSNFLELVELAGLDPGKHFRFMNLEGVDLRGCNLNGFSFEGAKIRNARFDGAEISGATFDRVQLLSKEIRSAKDFADIADIYHASMLKQSDVTETVSDNTARGSSESREAIDLSAENLNLLPPNIVRPDYTRDDLTAGQIHVGVGHFFRAHGAWYTNKIIQSSKRKDWGIVGSGVRPTDELIRQNLLLQDFLYTLISLSPERPLVEVIGAIVDFLPVEDQNAALIRKMSDPNIRIVSITVTEGGYLMDPATGALDIDNPDIQHDIVSPGTPKTVFGAILQGLRNRFSEGLPPVTCLSFDNLQGNGDVFRNAMLSIANANDRDFAHRIEDQVTFPNSVVDCMTPRTGESEVEFVKLMGIEDRIPVFHEPFRRWIIEERFCNGRPNWEDAGAIFTNDVAAYETLKINTINAGHQIIANVGELLSFNTISSCLVDRSIFHFVCSVLSTEVAPLTQTPNEISISDEIDLALSRFMNPKMQDTVRRVAFDGATRHSIFIVPLLRQALEKNTPMDGLALTEALWARMCTGLREDGTKIEPNDPYWENLNSVAHNARQDPRVWLMQKDIYSDLGSNERFASSFEKWLGILWQHGSRHALNKYISGEFQTI